IQTRIDKVKGKHEVGNNWLQDILQVPCENATGHGNAQNKSSKDGIDPDQISEPATEHHQHQHEGQHWSSYPFMTLGHCSQTAQQWSTNQQCGEDIEYPPRNSQDGNQGVLLEGGKYDCKNAPGNSIICSACCQSQCAKGGSCQ